MKHFILISAFATLGVVHALPNYPTQAKAAAANGYGKSQPTCKQVEDITYKEKCEEYTDRICRTTYNEQCHDVNDKSCRATISSSNTRQCFNVTEKLCTLKEEVSFEVIDAVFTVQRCNRLTEQVCDTIVDMDHSTTQREQCINIPSLVCNTEERTVYEKTCRTETRFDCDDVGLRSAPPSNYMTETDSYGQTGSPNPNYGDDTSAPSYGKSMKNAYGQVKDVSCEKHQETKCSTTPRQVRTQTCSKREERVCERLTERIPSPVERKVCRNEDKRVCRVEQKTQPKQVKKYVYTKVCRPMTKRVCENADIKSLVPSCIPTTRTMCNTTPNDHCEDLPKKKCHNVPVKSYREQCDDYSATQGYEAPTQGYEAPSQGYEAPTNYGTTPSTGGYEDGNTASYQ